MTELRLDGITTHACVHVRALCGQVIVAAAAVDLAPPYVWLGGGAVDLKLRVPVPQLVRSLKALVVACTTPRSSLSDSDNDD